MKRVSLLLLVLLVALPSFAFDSRRGAERIGVLDAVTRGDDGSWQPTATALQQQLARELRSLGYDAWETGRTLDEIANEDRAQADYFVEILSEDGRTEGYGGIGISTRNVGIDAEVVVARVAARIRVYDAGLREVGTFDLDKRNTTVLPSSIGVGRHNFALWIALPFVERARFRSAMRAVAHDAAQRVADATSSQ